MHDLPRVCPRSNETSAKKPVRRATPHPFPGAHRETGSKGRDNNNRDGKGVTGVVAIFGKGPALGCLRRTQVRTSVTNKCEHHRQDDQATLRLSFGTVSFVVSFAHTSYTLPHITSGKQTMGVRTSHAHAFYDAHHYDRRRLTMFHAAPFSCLAHPRQHRTYPPYRNLRPLRCWAQGWLWQGRNVHGYGWWMDLTERLRQPSRLYALEYRKAIV